MGAMRTIYASIEEDNDLAVKTKPKVQRPAMYKVILLNDDYTPMDFVVEVLRKFFGITEDQAFALMLTVHTKGAAVVGVFTREIAESKVVLVMDYARQFGHPLQCIMERED